jgi:hypothetical protein
MLYIISFYNDEYESQESDFLLSEYPEVCDGHLRIGDTNVDFTTMLCELYVVYDEKEFLQLIKMMQRTMPHLEAFKKRK